MSAADPAHIIKIRTILRYLKLNPDEECMKVVGCKTRDLTANGAAKLANHLTALWLKESAR